MATKKSAAKGVRKSAGKAAAVAPPPPTAVSVRDVPKAVQAAVERAIKEKHITVRPRKFPIFLGIWYNPISRKYELVNQFED